MGVNVTGTYGNALEIEQTNSAARVRIYYENGPAPETGAANRSMLNPATQGVQLIGGIAVASFSPDPSCNEPVVEPNGASILRLDSSGNLSVRGQVITDEKSLRFDFSGDDFHEAATGTFNFTTGSQVVTGSGTLFTTELDMDDYVKLSADPDAAFSRVVEVLDDTHCTIEDPYAGVGGSGPAVISYWFSTINGGGIAQSASKVVISSGTTALAENIIQRVGDYGPLSVGINGLQISQRIAGQEAVLGLTGHQFHGREEEATIVFSGPDPTYAKFRTRSSAAATDLEETTFIIPNGVTSATISNIDITVGGRSCILTINDVKVAEHTQHIPGPYTPLDIVVGWDNTGAPVSSSDLTVDSIFFSNQDKLNVGNEFRGEALPVTLVDAGGRKYSGEEAYTATMDIAPTTLVDGTVYAAMVNTGAKVVLVRILQATQIFSGTPAASTSVYSYCRFTGGLPTGGAAGSPTKIKTSYTDSTIGSLRFDNAGLSVIGLSFENPLWISGSVNQYGQYFSSLDLGNEGTGAMFELKPGEGFCLRAKGAVVAGSRVIATMVWYEQKT